MVSKCKNNCGESEERDWPQNKMKTESQNAATTREVRGKIKIHIFHICKATVHMNVIKPNIWLVNVYQLVQMQQFSLTQTAHMFSTISPTSVLLASVTTI